MREMQQTNRTLRVQKSGQNVKPKMSIFIFFRDIRDMSQFLSQLLSQIRRKL